MKNRSKTDFHFAFGERFGYKGLTRQNELPFCCMALQADCVVRLMADFERKSAIDVHAGLQPVAGWPFDAGSRSGHLQSRFRDPLCGPLGLGLGGQSLVAAPRENFVAWATV